MAYAPPSIGLSGLTIPSYQDTLDYLVAQYQGIYGAACYLGNDSADFQDLAVRALIAFNASQSLQGVYLSLNPQTAVGTSLDLCGKMIGTPRKAATFSSVLLTVSGTAGTVITNGVARDSNGNLWSLATPATIGGGGTSSVVATAQKVGNITANPAAITIIATPTAGWTGVTNLAAAIPGQAVELDSQYRARLLISQAKPSLTLLAGTAAAVQAITGVTRSVVYENPRNYTTSYGLLSTSGTAFTVLIGYPLDSTMIGQPITISGVAYTISAIGSSTTGTLASTAGTQTSVPYFVGDGIQLGPAHSITAVVEGGSTADIAQAIYDNRNIGCLTNGTTAVSVTDARNPGISMTISFDVLAYSQIYAALNVHPLGGYTSATQAAIVAGIASYLNSLSIGESVVFSELYGAALTARPNPDVPIFSIRSMISGIAAAQTTATLNSTTSITVASATGIVNGQTVVGAGIPNDTTVVGVSGTTITLSAAATATATGVPLTFFNTGTGDLSIAYDHAAQGSSIFVTINIV
jgi:uncharacterized phage protein gp47/JayE